MKRPLLLLLCSLLVVAVMGQCCVEGMGTELVQNGNFSQGNIGFTTSYNYRVQAAPGAYGIVTEGSQANSPWAKCKDHTTGTGNFMWVDASSNSNINVWTQQISGLQPNTNYIFLCWINNLGDAPPATLQFSINSTLVGSQFTAPQAVCNWQRFYYVWNSGTATSAIITITNKSVFGYGNDVGIDDISFKQCFPPVSKTTASICFNKDYTLPSGKTITTAGVYNDTIQGANGCDSIITVTLSVSQPIADSITLKQPVCAGGSFGVATIYAWGGNLPYTFKINAIGSNSTGLFDSIPPGNYNYTITDNSGCVITGDFEIFNAPQFIFVTANPPDTIIDPGSPVLLTGASNVGNATFSWAPDIFLSCSTCPNPIASPTQDITYTLTAIVPVGAENCTADTVVKILMTPDFWIPNSFTPNGDLMNDFFAPTSVGIKELELTIYSTYGEEIFNCQGRDCMWDGTYKSKPCPIGVYGYMIRVKTNTGVKINRKGNVSLLR